MTDAEKVISQKSMTRSGEGFRMTPADRIGLPSTPDGRRLFQAAVADVIKASKQRLVDIGYTDTEGNVIRPELGRLPIDPSD